MKTQLTKEQSQHLIDLGVPNGKASNTIARFDDDDTCVLYHYPIFTLTDLLEILPKYLDYEFEGVNYAADFTFHWSNRFLHYEAGYDLYDMWDKSHYCAKELIDALYELVCWCIENKHIKC